MKKWWNKMVQFIFKNGEIMNTAIESHWVDIGNKLINLSLCEAVTMNNNMVTFWGSQNNKIGVIVCESLEKAQEVYGKVSKIINSTNLKSTTNKKTEKGVKNVKKAKTKTRTANGK
jgi:hypothetical protein